MGRININEISEEKPIVKVDDKVSEQFLMDIQEAISLYNSSTSRTPSKTYKPSCLGCSRMMYYMRKGYKQDSTLTDYQGVGMADTGTRRHVAIQEVLEKMRDMCLPWEYVDVGKYIEQKHREGKIIDTEVTDYRGHECHLKNSKLFVSCMCDGILRNVDTGHYYLFEFKNQISFKAVKRDEIDESHYNQIIAYATLLDLDDVIMLYENRDTCELKCPPVYHVTAEDKESFVTRLEQVETLVQESIIPAAERGSGACKFCDYKAQCREDGGASKICSHSSESTQESLGLLQ